MRHARHHAEVVRDQQDGEAEILLQIEQEAQDLRLHGDVERGGRLVGDQQLGLAHQRHGDHHALAQPAGELVRVLAEAHPRRGDAHAREQLGGAIERGGARGAAVALHDLRHLRADGVGRVEARHRLLEDHRHPVAAQARHLALGQRQELAPVEAQPAGATRRGARQQAHDRERGHRLAAARLADQARRLAAMDGERRLAHRGEVAEADLELLDREQRAHAARPVRSMSRSPSPSRLMPKTRTNSESPGTMITQGWKNM